MSARRAYWGVGMSNNVYTQDEIKETRVHLGSAAGLRRSSPVGPKGEALGRRERGGTAEVCEMWLLALLLILQWSRDQKCQHPVSRHKIESAYLMVFFLGPGCLREWEKKGGK